MMYEKNRMLVKSKYFFVHSVFVYLYVYELSTECIVVMSLLAIPVCLVFSYFHTHPFSPCALSHSLNNHRTSLRGAVRNLGKPVALCKQYFDGGADEVVFLNITSFRQGVIEDLPMLKVGNSVNTCLLHSTWLYSALMLFYFLLLLSV